MWKLCYRHNKAVYPLIFEYPMTSIVHKILFHGLFVVQKALLLIVRQLSQEGTETRDKHIHSFRLHHAGKSSNIATWMVCNKSGRIKYKAVGYCN